jgi:hypothetical protein
MARKLETAHISFGLVTILKRPTFGFTRCFLNQIFHCLPNR